jgi:hypothetical protein
MQSSSVTRARKAELGITHPLGVGLNDSSAVNDTVVGTSRCIGLSTGDPSEFEESFVANGYDWTFPAALTVYVIIENPRNRPSIGSTESVTASMSATVTVNYDREGEGLVYEASGEALETAQSPF